MMINTWYRLTTQNFPEYFSTIFHFDIFFQHKNMMIIMSKETRVIILIKWVYVNTFNIMSWSSLPKKTIRSTAAIFHIIDIPLLCSLSFENLNSFPTGAKKNNKYIFRKKKTIQMTMKTADKCLLKTDDNRFSKIKKKTEPVLRYTTRRRTGWTFVLRFCSVLFLILIVVLNQWK
jgi:hypothetical protein